MIKGFSMEIQAPELKNQIKDFAEDIYIYSFFISIFTLIYMFILYYIILSSNHYAVSIWYILLLIGAYFFQKYIFTPQKNHRLHHQVKIISDDENVTSNSIISKIETFIEKVFFPIQDKINLISPRLSKFLGKVPKSEPKTLTLVSLVIFMIMISGINFILLSFIMQGHITTDMASIHNKNEPLIPVSIIITGPKNDFFINLSKGDANHDISLIDSIKFKQKHDSNKIEFSENSYLFGNEMQSGMYNIFINTTTLTEGYYELTIKNKYRKGFYLLSAVNNQNGQINPYNSTITAKNDNNKTTSKS